MSTIVDNKQDQGGLPMRFIGKHPVLAAGIALYNLVVLAFAAIFAMDKIEERIAKQQAQRQPIGGTQHHPQLKREIIDRRHPSTRSTRSSTSFHHNVGARPRPHIS